MLYAGSFREASAQLGRDGVFFFFAATESGVPAVLTEVRHQ